MWLKTPSASLKLRGVLLLFLLATSCAWVLKGKKGGKDAPQERVPKTKVQASLPPTTFLRIFALPSEEAKMAQHRLGELLAAACKNYARNGGCGMSSSSDGHEHIRILEFQDGTNTSIIAYMLQENEADIEKALDACEAKSEGQSSAAIENGKDYRCYMETAVNIPSRLEVLESMRKKLEEMGVYEELSKAPHKSIFLTGDPRLIVYQEVHRLVGTNNDYDFFLQKVRTSYRRVIEWLAWQHQEIVSLVDNTPLLYTHAEELDNNEQAEIVKVMEFLEIQGHHHVGDKVVTAKRGEMKFQKDRLRAALQTLPGTMLADIEEFLEETLQDKRLVAPYVGNSTSSKTSWPQPKMLQDLAIDNTILVTAATCSYAPLIINWMKQINSLGIPCFIVIALDDEIYNFLHNWQPDHVIRAPPGFTPVVPRQYATKGSGAMKHLSRVRIAALKAITDQGYNVAWADADISLTRNIFTIMSRWFDFTASWSGGSGEPMAIYEKTAGYNIKFPADKNRIISPSFLYFRGSDAARDFLDIWHDAANKSTSEEDGVILNRLLRDPDTNAPLNVELLPESTFPSGQNLFHNASSSYKKEWSQEPAAWAHPDSADTLEEKVQLLSANNFWKVVPEDPSPTCRRPEEDYLDDGTVVKMWPSPSDLADIAQDNTIFVTSSTCTYADLATNWVKHIHGISINCFFVAAADKPTAAFFEEWVPSHASQIPAHLTNKVSQFAEKSTAAYTKVVISRPLVLRKIMEQGYNVAWSDADIAWIRNPFTMLDKSEDVVLTEADNSQITQGAYYQHGEFADKHKGMRIGSGFIYLKAKDRTLALMDAWAAKLNSSSYVDDAAALNSLLASNEFKNLTIRMLPSAAFPTANELTKDATSDLKEAWEEEGTKPAWVHADSATSHDGKVQVFKSEKQWRVEKDDPQPKCAKPSAGGRKLGDEA